MDLSDLRQSYTKGSFSESDLLACPFAQFEKWFREAEHCDLEEPNAMCLATADPNGLPSARIVLLKEFSEKGLTFYTNYESRKARQLENNPWATMHFPWFFMERQVVVSGTVGKVVSAVSEEYFRSRPLMSKLGAWASRQSEELDSRETLERSFLEAREKWGEDPPKPEHWGGYSLNPESIEFWQGGPSRLHDRFIYKQESGEDWTIQRYFP